MRDTGGLSLEAKIDSLCPHITTVIILDKVKVFSPTFDLSGIPLAVGLLIAFNYITNLKSMAVAALGTFRS